MPDSSGIVTINRTEYEILYFFTSLFPLPICMSSEEDDYP